MIAQADEDGADVSVAVDVVVGLDFILLAFGIGAAVTGASLFWDGSLNLPFTSNWESLVTFFGMFSLCILVPLRILVKRLQKNDEVTDINHY